MINRKISALIAVLLAVFVLAVYFYFYWTKINNREKLAAFLPAESTIGFVEYNLNGNSQIIDIVKKNKFLKEKLIELESLISEKDIFDNWYSNKGGVAFLTTQNGHDYKPVIFLGHHNADFLSLWISKLKLNSSIDNLFEENYMGQKLIGFRSGQFFYILLSGDYLILADNREILEQIAETVAGKKESLREEPDYNKVSSALPEQNIGFIYIKRSKLLSMLAKNSDFLNGRLAMYKLYFPFLNIFDGEAAAIRLKKHENNEKSLEIKHISFFNENIVNSPFTEINYSYSGKLEQYLPADVTFMAGGANLLDQRNKIQSYFESSGGLNALMFAGVMNEVKDILAGADSVADLDNNFFPIFQKNYLFYAGTSPNKVMRMGILIESANPEADLLRLKKVALAIGTKLAAQLTARPVEFQLPDGTKGEEIKAKLEDVKSQELNILGKKVEKISFNDDFSFLLWSDVSEKLIAVSNSISDMEQIINSTLNVNGIKKPKNKLISYPTEFYFIDLIKLNNHYNWTDDFLPFANIEINRKLSQIGIQSIIKFDLTENNT